MLKNDLNSSRHPHLAAARTGDLHEFVSLLELPEYLICYDGISRNYDGSRGQTVRWQRAPALFKENLQS
jgi:hypothetical protein